MRQEEPTTSGWSWRDAGALAALLVLAVVVRAHHPAWLPFGPDGGWFLVAARDLLSLRAPTSAYPLMYLSHAPLLFGPLLGLGLQGALVAWAVVGALGAPLLYAGLRGRGRLVALAAAAVLALLPVEITATRGLETPYFVSTLLALAWWGWTRGSALSLGVAAGSAAWASGLQLALGPAGLAVLAATLGRARADRRAGLAVLAGILPPTALLLLVDASRLQNHLVLLASGADGFVGGERTVLEHLATATGVPGVAGAGAAAVVVLSGLAGARAADGRRALGWAGLALAPYLGLAVLGGYLEAEHLGVAAVPLLVAAAHAGRWVAVPLLALAGLVGSVSVPPVVEEPSVERPTVVDGLAVWAEAMEPLQGRRAWVYVMEQGLWDHERLDPALLDSVAQVVAGRSGPDDCVIVTNGATRPARPDGFVPLALDAMVADLTVQAWHDPGCTWLQQDPDRFCRWLGGTMRPPPAPRLGAGPPVTAGALRCLGDAEAQEP